MRKPLIAIASSACLLCAAQLQAAPASNAGYDSQATIGSFSDYDSEWDDFYENWIKGKLSIGLTYSIFRLTDGDRPANREDDFLGNINELQDAHENNIFPILEYQACDYLNLGLTYTKIGARTMNFNNHESDGDAELKGPVIIAELTYPLWEKRLHPHIGLGVAFLKGDFNEDTWWNLGYASPESWEAYGKPTKKTRQNHYRDIEVDDQTKVFFTAGLSYRPHPHVKLDVSYRRISLDPDCNFAYDYGSNHGGRAIRNYGDFDMSGYFWLFTVSYIF